MVFTDRTYDDAMEMKDAGLVAASAAAEVDAAAKIIDLGGAIAIRGDLVVDATAIETDSSNEVYTIIVQGSNSATFASGINHLAELAIGHATGKGGAADVTDVSGRWTLPFRNEQNGTIYRYLRVYTIVAGTIASGINYSAFISLTRSN